MKGLPGSGIHRSRLPAWEDGQALQVGGGAGHNDTQRTLVPLDRT